MRKRLRRWGQENHFAVNGQSRLAINFLQFDFLLFSLPSEPGFLSFQRQLANPNFFLNIFPLFCIMKLQSCALVSINLSLFFFSFSKAKQEETFLFYSASSSIWDMISHAVGWRGNLFNYAHYFSHNFLQEFSSWRIFAQEFSWTRNLSLLL